MSEAFAVRKTDDKKTENKTWKLPSESPNVGRRCFSWALPRTRRNVRHQFGVTEPRTKFRRGIEPEGNALSPQAFGDPLHVLKADKKNARTPKRRTRELKEIFTFSNVVENQADEYNILIQLQFFVVASYKHGVNHRPDMIQNTQTQQK